jgi:hypothetical protein
VRESDTTRHCVLAPAPLPDGRPRSGAAPTDLERVVAFAHDCGGIALGGARATRTRLEEIEDRGSGDDGHGSPGCGIAAPSLREVPHHPVGRRQSERRPAGEHDGVDLVDDATRLEQRELARCRRAAAHLAAANSAGREHDDGDTGAGAGPVPGAHARHREFAHGVTPTSRAKSTINWSTVSVRSSINM